MATIKIDPQTTREIIKDITTSTLSAYQLGHKYKLSKIVKNHESDPAISREVDPSFVQKNPDHLEGVETGG